MGHNILLAGIDCLMVDDAKSIASHVCFVTYCGSDWMSILSSTAVRR